MDTTTINELYLYAVNTRELYEGQTSRIIDNIADHITKKRFNREKAVRAFYHAAETAARMYGEEHCSGHNKKARQRSGLRIFPPAIRTEVARMMLDKYEEEIVERAESLIGPEILQVAAFDWSRDTYGNPTAHYEVDSRRVTKRRLQVGYSDDRMAGAPDAISKAGHNPRWYRMVEAERSKRPHTQTALFKREPITLDR